MNVPLGCLSYCEIFLTRAIFFFLLLALKLTSSPPLFLLLCASSMGIHQSTHRSRYSDICRTCMRMCVCVYLHIFRLWKYNTDSRSRHRHGHQHIKKIHSPYPLLSYYPTYEHSIWALAVILQSPVKQIAVIFHHFSAIQK